jgi:hypothetical protein
MSTNDSDPELQQERERLGKLYARMTKGELVEVADDFASLSNTAREALSAEMERRGIQLAPTLPEQGDEVDYQKLVTLRKFRDLPEALLAKGSLESSGIDCYLGDDNMVRLDWFISNLIGGVKLRVKPEDVEAANQILDQPIPEEFDVEGVGEYEQPRCPQCEGLDVSFEELNKPVAYGTAWLNVPMPIHNKGWKCHACGHKWEDDVTP